MKRLCVVILLLVLTCGCAKQTVYETMSDNLQQITAEPLDVILDLPDEVAVSVFSNGNGNEIYISNDYTVETYLMPAGDMRKTVLEITGFDMEDVSILQTQADGIKRYECTWTSTGEGELQACRATILDDGNYHYVLTVIGDQTAASEHSEEWKQIFKSYMLKDTD